MQYITIEQILNDLYKVFKQKGYNPKDNIEDIMYSEGQLSVLRYLENKYKGKDHGQLG